MLLTLMLMVAAALVSALLAIALYQWVRLQRLRRRASLTDVSAWVGTLLRSYAPGSVLIAEPNGKEGFLQFALTQRDREWRTLEFGLPETAWSRAAMAEVQDILDSAGVSWTIEDTPSGSAIDAFLRAELNGDRTDVLERASRLIPRIATAMGHPLHQTYHIQLLGHDSPEYQHELAEQLENLPTGGGFEKKLAEVIRGRTDS
jgi:type II secretory pathway pseudopilin PulG